MLFVWVQRKKEEFKIDNVQSRKSSKNLRVSCSTMDSWEDKYGRYFMNNDNGIAHFQELHDHIIIISPSLL